ncbi:MAG: branched-chain amino acid transport system permease protein [Gaiellales bacterium]|jgi:branched-chain amino acid transport system permease protein|nr:branched-chain amino acid transport system permease protein [Gaiellales bacterium]
MTTTLSDAWYKLPWAVRRLIVPAIVVALFVFYPEYVTSLSAQWFPQMSVMVQMCVFAMMALGLNVVVGYAGLLDLGYVAFYAAGSYVAGMFATQQFANTTFQWKFHFLPVAVPQILPGIHISVWLLLAVGAAFAAVLGIAIGLPTLRLRGDYLAIVTLGFGEIIPQAVNNGDDVFGHNVTNGPNGLTPIDQLGFGTSVHNAVSFLPANYHSEINFLNYYYWTGLALVAFTLFCCIRLRDSRLGRAWVAIREDEIAAAAMGVPLMRTKTWAYAIGAFFGGLAGCFYAIEKNSTFPGDFSLNISIFVLCMVILGGMGNVWGVMLGAVVLTYLNYQGLAAIGRQLNIDISTYSYGFFGLIIVIMMLLRPEGLIPSRRRRVEFRAAAEGVDVGQAVAQHE